MTPACSNAFKFTLKYLDGANWVFTMPSIITNTNGVNNKVDFTANSADKNDAGKIYKVNIYPVSNDFEVGTTI